MFYTCGFTFSQLAFYVEQTEKVSIFASTLKPAVYICWDGRNLT